MELRGLPRPPAARSTPLFKSVCLSAVLKKTKNKRNGRRGGGGGWVGGGGCYVVLSLSGLLGENVSEAPRSAGYCVFSQV